MAEPADLAFLRRLAFDVLHRSPRDLEVRSALGMPVDRVAGLWTRKLEAAEQLVEEELFYFLLIDGFRPRTEAIEALPARLQSGAATIRDALAEILLSTGFSLRNPGNDTFVTVVLEQCLGLAVQDRKNKPTLDAGKQLYDGKPTRFLGRQGNSQADVVRIVLEHPDATRHLLDRHHRRVFGAPLASLPRAEVDAVVERVHGDPAQFGVVLVEWFAADRYRAALRVKKPKTDRQFVRSLYNDLLEREPSYDELRNIRNALQSMADATPLHAVMVKLVLESKDAKLPACSEGHEDEFVRACFARYLGRAPTQDEATAMAAILREPDTSPRHLVRALLAAPEYGYC